MSTTKYDKIRIYKTVFKLPSGDRLCTNEFLTGFELVMTANLPAEHSSGSTAPLSSKAKRAKAEAILVDSAADIAESLVSVAKGEKTARREQIDAMKTVLDRAGIIPPERQASSDTKDLSELSPLELQSLLQGVEEQLARHAKPVSAARLDDRRTQPIDIFD